jgi:hypothetical protein
MFFIQDQDNFKKLDVIEQKNKSQLLVRCKSRMAKWQCNKRSGHSEKHTFENSELSLNDKSISLVVENE